MRSNGLPPHRAQMDKLEQVDQMAAGRLLLLLNPQFRREADFGLWQRAKARAAYFDKGYVPVYAFTSLARHGRRMGTHGGPQLHRP